MPKPKPNRYIITVIVEHVYEKVIEAPTLEAAEEIADTTNIQDDENNYVSSDTMESIVEPYTDVDL